MKSMAAVVLAFSLSASSLAHAQEPEAPPPPAPPAAAPVALPAAAPAPPPPPMMTVQTEPQAMWGEPPSGGVGYLVTGGIFTGLGVLNLATAPLAPAGVLRTVSLVFGGTLAAIGVPLIIVGAVKRSKFNEWKANHAVAAGVGFTTADGGGSLTFSGRF